MDVSLTHVYIVLSMQDDEYAIYDTSQQRQRYLVEFTLPNDKVKGIISQSEEEISASEDILADVVEIGNWDEHVSSAL